jgi:hypothetical protein
VIDVLTLHLGHIKTGTSSLQQTFRDSADALAEHGLYYYASHRSQHPIARAFDPANARGADKRHVTNLQREAARRQWAQGLISSELMADMQDDAAERLVAEMRKLAREVRALMYVRHPIALANSAAAQGVRSGRAMADIAARPRVLPLRRIVERWWNLLGREGLVVRPFDKAVLVRGDVIDDTLSVLGIPEAAEGLKRRKANEALSVLGIDLLERAQAETAGTRWNQQMIRPFEDIRGPKFVLPQAALEDVRRRGEAELAFLEESFGIDLPEPVPAPVPTEPPPLTDDELQSLARVLAEDASVRTTAARLVDLQSPYTAPPWDVERHRFAPLMQRLGLSAWLTRPRPPRSR